MSDCIFCKIAAGDIPATLAYQDDQCVAFHDIQPKAPVHLLVIPRRHIASLLEVEAADAPLLGHLLAVAARLAREHGLTAGYKTQINIDPCIQWGDSTNTNLQTNCAAAGIPAGALAGAGIVARGVLVDVPGVLGVDVVGRVVTRDDVAAVLDRTGTELRPGDVLHVHLGRREPARSDVPLGSVATAGLSIECAEWLAAARPAAVVTDEGLDPMPSEVDGLPVPWHVLVGENIAVLEPEPTDAQRRATWFNLPEGGPW